MLFTYLESVYVTWMMSYKLSCISFDQLQNSNPCVEVWHNESFHLFFFRKIGNYVNLAKLDVSGGQQKLL
jgi:hypothetical protein